MSDKQHQQLIRDLETVLDQLREGHSETSAAIAADLLSGLSIGSPTAKVIRQPKLSLRKRFKRFVLRTVLTLVVLGGVGIGAYVFFAEQNKPTISSFVTGVQGMAKLATAEAYVMTTVEGSDNKLFGMDITADLPGTKRHYMVIVPAKILAGVNLQGISATDIKLDDSAKTVEISLPHAEILEDAIQMNDIKLYTEEGLLRSATTAKEGVDLIAQASVKDRLRQQAQDAGLLKSAEENASQALQKLYDQFGYHVVITYR